MVSVLHPPSGFASWRVRMQVSIHSEMYFITFLLDQPAQAQSNELLTWQERLGKQPPTDDEAAKFVDRFYRGVWEELDAALKKELSNFPGRRFAEFRGVILRDGGSQFPARPSSDGFATLGPTREDFAAKFKLSRDSLRQWLARNHALVRHILPLDTEGSDNEVDRDPNCVLCEILDGAGIYGSSARQTHETDEDAALADASPMRYLIVYNGLSKYELGRLMRRLQSLGLARIGAVLDLARIDAASTEIRAVGNFVDEWLERARRTTYKPTGDPLREVLRRMNQLSSSDIPGGLVYRINRSRYYAKNFRDEVEELKVKPLAPWQTYSEFFERNLYHAFDFIDQTGTRYEALAARVQRLTAASVQQETRELSKSILDIQRLGEIIGWTAFAYYGGKIIEVAIQGIGEPICDAAEAAESAICKVISNPHETQLIGIVLALVVARVVWLQWRKQNGRHADAQ
jgi:hypothetical protein